MRQQPQNPNIDQRWFKQRLADRRLSVRALASALQISPSAASLMLRGISKVPDRLVGPLANQLLVDVAEIYRRLGSPVSPTEQTIIVSHCLCDDLEVHALPSDASFKTASLPNMSVDGFGIQVRAIGLYEHWMLFTSGLKCTPDQVLNQLCLYKNAAGQQHVSIIRSGYLPATFDSVSAFNDGVIVRDVQIEWAMPIIWIKPSHM